MTIQTGIIDPALALRIVATDSREIAYDTETNGLEHENYIVGYVVTNWDFSVYVPVRHGGGGNIPNVDSFERELAAAFNDRSRLGYRTVGHHLGFDLRMSLKTGFGGKQTPIILGAPLEDTMINESLIDDLTVGYGLDDCSRRHQVTVKLGDELYRELAKRFGGIPDRKQMQHFWKLEGDNKYAVDYATGDGVSTLELWRSQQTYLDEEELRVPWKLECDLLPYLARMYNRGMAVDMEYGARILADDDSEGSIASQIKEAASHFSAGFNVRSPKEVEALYRANGYRDEDFKWTTSKNPQPSFVEKWLQHNEIGQRILTLRQLENAKSKFINPLVSEYNHAGRIHPVLHQSKSDEYGVAGARLSCSDPNMQAQPKRNKIIGKLVRPLIKPDFGLIYELDFQQQEPRFFTHYSEEPALVEGYNSGTMDIHDRANEVLFNNEDRDKAKRLGMGMLTMMSVKTLAMHMECSFDEAKAMHRAFLTDAFPAIGQLQKDIVAVFKSRRVVKSILGRKARLDDSNFAYRGVSRVIQNSGGDHMKTGLLLINQLEDAHPDEFQNLLSIHDSYIFQTESQRLAREAQLLLESVAQQFKLIVPIPVDVGYGVHWGEASYLKRKEEWKTIVANLQ